MAENLSISSPDFQRIRKGDPKATEDAIRLLWFVANDETASRRKGVRLSRDRVRPRIKTADLGANQNNYDLEGAGFLLLTGASARDVTGIRAQEEGDVILIHNIGSGTITFKHNSGSSDAANRMLFQAAVDKAVATNKSLVLQYLNTNWRELSLA